MNKEKIVIHCTAEQEHELLKELKCSITGEYLEDKYWDSEVLFNYLIKFDII